MKPAVLERFGGRFGLVPVPLDDIRPPHEHFTQFARGHFVSRFVRDHDVRVLCQYNRDRFSPEIILSVIRTHPVVVYGGVICNNPYYVPPEEFLKPNTDGAPIAGTS